MVFKKEKADKVKPVVGDVIEPVKKHGPTVHHEAHAGPHFSHEEKQHIKYLKKKIREHKPLTEEDAQYAKDHKVDISHATISTGDKAKSQEKPHGKKKANKVNYDTITFD